MKKRIIKAAAFVVVLIVISGVFAANPIIVNKTDVPESYLTAVENQSKGVYSKRIPLVPIFTTVDSYTDNTVYYTIHYFPFGTVGMSYNNDDTYNIEKPLTRF